MAKQIPVAHDLRAAPPASEDAPAPVAVASTRWWQLATEPYILFPLVAVVALAAIWGTTLIQIRDERAAAAHATATSSHELVELYETQVVRALREIDLTLKLVKYAYERGGKESVLQELKARSLLPPELLFVVSIADRKGNVVASTGRAGMPNIASQNLSQSRDRTNAIEVNRPQQDPVSGEWTLVFSRRLDAADGSYGGIVMISVAAAYFVSGYEASQLGRHGLLAVIGTDGIIRARRSGETISAGGIADYGALVMHAPDEAKSETSLQTDAWDGVRRYISARRLYGFPLAVIVGLSADEQMAPMRRAERSDLWRAAGVSLLLILILGVMARMSWQLVLSRRRTVEEHVHATAQAQHLAHHDSLTLLPNRGLFNKLLGRSIKQAHRHKRQLALLFLDLDHFKNINDTLGHEAGDQLLQEVAARLEACVRDSDTVARLGGDEFVVLLLEIDVEKYVATVAQKILSAIARPFVLAGQESRVTASIGISTYPQDGLDEQTLTRNADSAMYQAKEEGKNQFRFYSGKLNASALERLELESGLRHALERNEFQLHYQAKRNVRDGRITGMEALLRWQHPALGTVAPMRFIPVAEETGLIVPLGRWVLRTACVQNVAWQAQGLPHLSMAVNLTPRQFYDEGLLPDLAAILQASAMDGRLLELEIHESLLMHDVEKTLSILTGLKGMGIRIAIDDFGIGYSSLSSLRQFPLDTIKIDRSLIRDVAHVHHDKDLAAAIIAMGRTLSLNVVAQGVETKEQADFLRQKDYGEFQGFYLNKPMPADEVAELLRTRSESAHIDTDQFA